MSLEKCRKEMQEKWATNKCLDTCSDVGGAHINFMWNFNIENHGVARSRPQLPRVGRSMRPHGTTLI